MSNMIQQDDVVITSGHYDDLLKSYCAFRVLVGTLSDWCELHGDETLDSKSIEMLLEYPKKVIKEEKERWQEIINQLSATDC